MDFKKIFENLFASNTKKTKLITFLALLGIMLITLASFWPTNKNSKNKTLKNNFVETDINLYANQLENKINNIIKKIEGVGNCKVLITMENGIENIYANSEKKISNLNDNMSGMPTKQSDIQRDVALVDGNEGKQALMITQKEPTVKGVVVVCQGAENGLVAKRVTDAVSKALHIKINRLSVVKGNPK